MQDNLSRLMTLCKCPYDLGDLEQERLFCGMRVFVEFSLLELQRTSKPAHVLWRDNNVNSVGRRRSNFYSTEYIGLNNECGFPRRAG